MNEQSNDDFKNLIRHACSMLAVSLDELREKYASYPICLMNYIEEETQENMVEVRFDNEQATISCLLNKQQECTDSYLFLDNECDEKLLIDYLIKAADYNFRKSCWTLPNCNLRVKDMKSCCVFYFYKQM